ncbi:phage protein, HK97 gp10 family [Peptoclostridium acidaminophilum DSM 3953]|uniref:Phage protein, HK97 gp10 family n=2 Tax=Peptoclostridium acidaminophilum TaxID=1731 RepID=W8T4V4_PEPAC|nr:HK97-gp10 family putative phage morphogenesis protein [Peptoclostridium acidaminophilum]AHM55895.1 phage protein, HK97 gp10 family [Peptoclostridium acidaminophilum DSM 3953]
MAKATMRMPDEFLMKLSKLGDKTDEIVSKALEAGGEVVLDKVKANLKGVIGNGTKEKSRSTGELVTSLGLSPTKIDKNGNSNVKIGFNEPRSDGDANAKIANILEYGKSGQPPKPFLKPAKSASRKSCIETMKAELNKEIEKL